MHSLRLLLARVFTDIADLFAKIAKALTPDKQRKR
jgi:hypothetical protein